MQRLQGNLPQPNLGLNQHTSNLMALGSLIVADIIVAPAWQR